MRNYLPHQSRRIIYFVIALNTCFFLNFHCSLIQPINGIELLKGKSRFDYELANLTVPKGVLPETFVINSENQNLLTRDTAIWNEFFVYDRRTFLVILSPAPLYFVKIQSEDFFFHLEREYNQIARSLSGKAKEVSSSELEREIGDFQVGLHFTPRELSYNNDQRISQIGIQITQPDIWRLLQASSEAVVYLPNFEETQLFEDLQKDVAQGRPRWVYTKTSMIPALDSKHIISHSANFSFIMGKNLQKTNCLLNKQEFFLSEEYEITRDFIAFFSLPLGDANCTGRAVSESANCRMAGTEKDFLETDDGIVILYKGNLSRFENFFSKDGFDLSNTNGLLSSGTATKTLRCDAKK